MSTWESEMTPKEWEDVMGVPYSHISLEEQEANRKFNEQKGMEEPWTNDKVQQVLSQVESNWSQLAREWCNCVDYNGDYTFFVPPNRHCSLCKATINNDHYHCGACSKISQVG